ncbi:MAG: ArsI/CadI family heavy metal resistance metalloenzyme [Tepidisphaeraceae bacterium]
MKRFHVHVSVKNLPESIGFYSRLFGVEPSVTKTDYAKWMLDDPRINFAISERGHAAGINHLGLQVDSGEELAALREQAEKAELDALDEKDAACCYAKSDKYWVKDPQGIAWETFHSLGSIPIFGEDATPEQAKETCCVPKAPAVASARSGCCG